jgi:hypothetical protein
VLQKLVEISVDLGILVASVGTLGVSRVPRGCQAAIQRVTLGNRVT